MTARLFLFGSPTVEFGGERLALPFERRNQLLAFLALKRSWVGRAELAATLWPEQETKLEKPKLFKVLLHNDDFTTMEFVVFVLEYVFMKSSLDAFTIMLKVHNEGIGLAGVYPYEVANMKAEKAMNLARSREYPLLCTVEEE